MTLMVPSSYQKSREVPANFLFAIKSTQITWTLQENGQRFELLCKASFLGTALCGKSYLNPQKLCCGWPEGIYNTYLELTRVSKFRVLEDKIAVNVWRKSMGN